MQLLRKIVFVALGVVAALVIAVPIGWAIDSSTHGGKVARNTTLAGLDVGGLSRAELVAAVGRLASRYEVAPVRIDAPLGGFSTDAKALGLEVDQTETVKAAFAVGREGSAGGRMSGWMRSLLRPRKAPVRVTVRTANVYSVVEAGDPGPRTSPQEPTIAFEKGAFRAVPGKPGSGIDPATVIAELPDAADDGIPIVVKVERGEVQPRYRLEEAEALAVEAQSTLKSPLDVQAGTAKATVSVAAMRPWIRAEPSGDVLTLGVDAKRVATDLAKLLPKAGTTPTETTFRVAGGTVEVVPGKTGTACCDDSAPGIVAQAIFAGSKGPVKLPLKRVEPEVTEEEAASLGIKEVVGEFTTKHPAGQARVRNIHRISDLVRGQVIKPGETFSVNDFVGRRTAANGFVSAGVIEDGKFTEDIGGGISQFATTLFNAAFFAGLDLVEYQSHSIYIDRYPYGREATLSFPKPDLKIKNSTPHGILIWPSYTESTITVTLYSTKFVTAEQTGQSKGPKGNCTLVTTQRTRTYLADGKKEVDRVTATYRPAEGVNC